MDATAVSRYCADGLHGFCPHARSGCACSTCHLGPCTECGQGNLQRMYADGTLCADCYRKAARSSARPSTPCDRCANPGAFRNPAQRGSKFLCPGCHQAAGHTLPLASSVTQLVAACLGADVSDPRHNWAHVRGNTFGCVRCKAKNYDPDMRTAMRRAELNER